MAGVAAVCGCGGEDGPEIRETGTGYELGVPAGWVESRALASRLGSQVDAGSGAEVDLMLADAREPRAMTAMALVVRDPDLGVATTQEQYFESRRRQLPPTLRLVRGPVDTTLGGRKAISFDVAAGPRTRMRQVLAIRDRVAYVVALVTSADRFDDKQPEFEQVLAGWRWRG